MTNEVTPIESADDLIELIKQNIRSLKKDLLINYPYDDIKRFEVIKRIRLQELTLEFMENIKDKV